VQAHVSGRMRLHVCARCVWVASMDDEHRLTRAEGPAVACWPRMSETQHAVILALTSGPTHADVALTWLCHTLFTQFHAPPRPSGPHGSPSGVVGVQQSTAIPTPSPGSTRSLSQLPPPRLIAGTPDAPRCGFSSKVVQALRQCGEEFGSFDILSDEDVRQGLKVRACA
jgi:hypothetical protein